MTGGAFQFHPEAVTRMPTPPLDCGCPCRPAYTLTRGAITLTLCAHHGRASEVAARAQGFTVITLAAARV